MEEINTLEVLQDSKIVNFLSRAGFEEESALKDYLGNICKKSGLGPIKSWSVIQVGFEDLNTWVETPHGKYFIKVFANFRRDGKAENQGYESSRWLEIYNEALRVGVNVVPMLVNNGNSIFQHNSIECIILDFIEDGSLEDSGYQLNDKDVAFIIEQTYKIQQMDIANVPIDDSWAIVNFKRQLSKLSEEAKDGNINVEQKVLNKLNTLLPHYHRLAEANEFQKAFVHADLLRPNIVRKGNGEIFIIDFSVAQHYPRIVEYAVLLCQPMSDHKDLVLSMLESHLTEAEIKFLPHAVELAHAANIVGGYLNMKKNPEDAKHFISLGEEYLKLK